MNIKSLPLHIYTGENFCKIFYILSLNSRNVNREIHRHDFFQILLLKQGRMKIWIDFEEKQAEGPFASVLFPNQVHRIELSEDAELDIIMFDQTVFCSSILSNELKEYNIDLQNRINYVQEIPTEEWTEMLSILGSIKNLWARINMIRKMEIKFLIKIMLLKIIDIAPLTYQLGNIDSDVQIYQRFREMIDIEYKTNKKIISYAEKLGVSTKKLTAVCHKYTGSSPLEIIHQKMAVELKKALVEDGSLLKEIAFEFGFSSQSALNKFIEKQFGCSPQTLRAELEKNMLGKI